MARAKRGSTPVLTPEGRRGHLRRQLLVHYDTDAEFGRGLIALWRHAKVLRLSDDWRTIPPLIWIDEPTVNAVREHFDLWAERLAVAERDQVWKQDFAPVGAYLAGLVALAERFGLDRLGPEGIETIHRWCVDRQQAAEVRLNWPRTRFSQTYGNFGPVIEVGEAVETDLGILERDGRRIALIAREVRPVVHVAGRTARADIGSEPRAVAFARLRRRRGKAHEGEIRAELDRLEALAAKLGAVAADTRRNQARDLEWLFWHLRYRERPLAVARRAGLTDDDVSRIRKAVERVARDVEVALHSGWTDYPDGRPT
jgi:hypothetical protein